MKVTPLGKFAAHKCTAMTCLRRLISELIHEKPLGKCRMYRTFSVNGTLICFIDFIIYCYENLLAWLDDTCTGKAFFRGFLQPRFTLRSRIFSEPLRPRTKVVNKSGRPRRVMSRKLYSLVQFGS